MNKDNKKWYICFRMTFGNKIAYAFLGSFMWLMSRLPLGFHRANGKFIGKIVCSVVKYRREVVETNLAKSFPEKSEVERAGICKRFYEHLGNIIGEAVWFGSTTNRERLRKSRIVVMDNPELLNGYYDKGQSVMVLASHNGNFELLAGIKDYAAYTAPLEYEENNISVVYKRLSDPVWDKFLFKNRKSPLLDKKNYDALVECDEVMRYVYKHYQEKFLFIFITDQYPYGDPAKVEVEFMHQKTYSMVGGVALAKMLGMPVVYMNMEYRSEGGYMMKFTPICDNAANEDIKALTDRYYKLVEADICKQPWNYLWSHRRWK